jgi:tripartite-type tricarboxylate transporter receptor subunit TctC
MPDVKKRLTDMGGIVTPLKSREFGDYIRTEMTRWQGVVTKANVKIE